MGRIAVVLGLMVAALACACDPLTSSPTAAPGTTTPAPPPPPTLTAAEQTISAAPPDVTATILAGRQPTAVPADVVANLLQACLATMSAAEISTTAAMARDCLQRYSIEADTLPVTGEVPVIFFERRNDGCAPGQTFDVVAWHDGVVWHTQQIDDPQLRADTYKLIVRPWTRVTGDPAREARTADGVRLTVIANSYSCGSGSALLPVMFAFDGSTWKFAWTPVRTALTYLTYPDVQFSGNGIDVLDVKGAAWPKFPDEPEALGKIFSESHPGPHRYFDETWTRKGDEYVMADRSELPSPYDALVHFMYSLGIGDDIGASKWLEDPALLARAKMFGLVQHPLGQAWFADDFTSRDLHQIHIRSEPFSNGPPQPVAVTFAERGQNWLMSAITAE